jgi:TolB-like protein/class 3 adenylate cyclase/cytochrome c-type biogenesis protein CcmH/NrfG
VFESHGLNGVEQVAQAIREHFKASFVLDTALRQNYSFESEMSSPEVKPEIRLEIGHVLFIDIVGYSKLLTTEQSEQMQKLREIVRATEQFRSAEAAGKLLRLPTGDGGALVFRTSPEAPVLCAMEIGRELRKHPELRVRMGIHSGPVDEITDLNEQANIAGVGINIAQRVMDCGDAGHILLSRHVAEDLEQYPRWRSQLHDLGECEVKHGARVAVTNLYSNEFGNSELPSKLQAVRKHRSHMRWAGAAIALLVLGAIVAAFFYVSRKPATSVADIPEKSVAVLPFVNMSEDKSNDYFSDGISEELLNLLSKVPQLQVAARTSSFSFKGKPIEIPEIARKLHVANVLEGSVRKSGDQLRITAKLIRAAEGYHLWSETYDRKLDDIFKIQDEIAGEVVKQLKVTLLGAVPTVRQTDPKAYALYLQAVQLGRQQTPEAFTQSDALFRQVLEIDPRYASAWHELARNFINKANAGLLPNSEGLARAREAFEKALAIDPDYAPAHAGLGRIAAYNNDFVNAAKHFERALALDPNDLNVLSDTALFLQNLGRLQEALALREAIVRRDPVNVKLLFSLGNVQRLTGQFDAAIASYRSALSLSPGRGMAHYYICEAMLLKGDAPAALAEIEQEKSEVWRLIGLPMAYHALGRKTESDAALATLIAKDEKWGPYNVAYVYAFRGEADKAFEWLDKAVQYEDPGLIDIAAENLFDKIHSDSRWLPFLRKIGRAPEQLAKIQCKVTLPPE